MDRDRERDRRPLDIPPEDQYGSGRGQSYRPGGAKERTPPPRADSYRARSPPRRNDYGDPYRGPRPRSRSPPRRDDFRRRSPSPRMRDRDGRGGADSYRGRPRSPPRRDDLPRDDLFRKEPVRDTSDYRDERGFADDRDRSYAARSPALRQRDRSPLSLKRGREPSPYNRRSPLPVKRERLASPPRSKYQDYAAARAQSPPRRRFSPEHRDRRPSPRREFRPRSRSPQLRNERADPRDADDWRRQRSPSPRYARQADYHNADENGDRSVTTSRRSSPPLHPSRLQQVDDRSGRPTPRDAYENRDSYRARSPEPRRAASPPPPPQNRNDYSEDIGYATQANERNPPLRESYRYDEQPAPRAPPAGPAGARAPSYNGLPTAPAGAASSSHARIPVAPPAGPRGDLSSTRGRGGYRGDSSGRGGVANSPYRGGRGGAPLGPAYGRGGHSNMGRSESYDRDSESNSVPSGPSTSTGGPPTGPREGFAQAPPPLRHSSNLSTTPYSRSQRFASNGQPVPEPSSATPTGPRASRRDGVNDRGPHPALADLPKPIEGGKKLESLVDRSKLDKLEEDAERLRRIIDEKEAKKRKAMREWDRLSRETEAAAYRSQVAEETLRKGSGDADVYSAAF